MLDPGVHRQVLRGPEFSSGHPAMQAINPRVATLTVGHGGARRRTVQ
jgi:hypothetical protein